MKRRVLVALLAIGGGLVPLACTAFDGLTAAGLSQDAAAPPSVDAGTDVHDATPAADEDAAIPLPPPSNDAGPPPTYLSLDDAARLCSLLFRCDDPSQPAAPANPALDPDLLFTQSILSSLAIPADPWNFASCMSWMAGPLPPNRVGIPDQRAILQCMAAAGTCAGALGCLPVENIARSDPRCHGSNQESCEDDAGTAVLCDLGLVFHCGSTAWGAGSQCITDGNGIASCGLDPGCPNAITCVDGGSTIQLCGDFSQAANCASEGMSCGIDQTAGIRACLTGTTQVACAQLGTQCSGTSVATCACVPGECDDVPNNLEESLFDCTALGGACAGPPAGAAGVPYCSRPNDQCTPFDLTMNVCQGSEITVCIGGKTVSYDCANLGPNVTCLAAPSAQGTSGVFQSAFCGSM
ncbi:MAG TPA: hypothetical protein VGI39_45705 [Polyangiaceae bacterium]|jgi:hypothetical protein